MGAAAQDGPGTGPARPHRAPVATGSSNTAIAADLGIAKHTVGKWRERFARLRTDGLLDEPRPGARRRIGDEQIAALVDRTLSERPEGTTQWRGLLGILCRAAMIR